MSTVVLITEKELWMSIKPFRTKNQDIELRTHGISEHSSFEIEVRYWPKRFGTQE